MSAPVYSFVLKAKDQALKVVQRVKKELGQIGPVALGTGAAVSTLATLAAAGTAAWVRKSKTLAMADAELHNLSVRLGVSARALSEFQHVASQTGVQFDNFVDALATQAEKINDAFNNTGSAKDWLKAFNLEAQDLIKLAPEKAFEKLLGAIKDLPNDMQRLDASMALFGEDSGKQVVQIAALGTKGLANLRKEAERLGITLSDTDAALAAIYGASLDRLQKSIDGSINQAIRRSYPQLISLATFFEKILPVATGIGTMHLDIFAKSMSRLVLGGVVFLRTMALIPERFQLIADSAGPLIGVFAKLGRSIDAPLASLEKSLRGLMDGTAITEMLKGLNTQLGTVKGTLTKLGKKTLLDQIKEMFKEFRESDPSVELTRVITLIERAREELGHIYSPMEFDALVEYFQKKIPASIDASIEKASIFKERIQSSFQNALGSGAQALEDALVNPSKKAFKQLAESWKDTLKRMLVQIALAKLGEAISSAIGGSGAGAGSSNRAGIIGLISSALAGAASSGVGAAGGGGGGGGSFVGGNKTIIKPAENSPIKFEFHIDARGADKNAGKNLLSAAEQIKNMAVAEIKTLVESGRVRIPRGAVT